MNALIDQLTALRLHGMAACAHDLLSARKPPSLTTAIKQLIDAETWAFIRRTAEFYPDDAVGLTIAGQRQVYDEMAAAFHAGRPDGMHVEDVLAD